MCVVCVVTESSYCMYGFSTQLSLKLKCFLLKAICTIGPAIHKHSSNSVG